MARLTWVLAVAGLMNSRSAILSLESLAEVPLDTFDSASR